MNDEPSTSEQWGACPSGELQELATRLRWRRRDRNVAKAVGLAGALAVFLLVGGLAVQQFRGPHNGPRLYGDISCREVQANIQQYVAGQLHPQLAESIGIHLEQCPDCGPPFRRMMAEMKQEMAFTSVPRAEPTCTCGHCRQGSMATEPRFLTSGSHLFSVAMHVPR